MIAYLLLRFLLWYYHLGSPRGCLPQIESNTVNWTDTGRLFKLLAITYMQHCCTSMAHKRLLPCSSE